MEVSDCGETEEDGGEPPMQPGELLSVLEGRLKLAKEFQTCSPIQ